MMQNFQFHLRIRNSRRCVPQWLSLQRSFPNCIRLSHYGSRGLRPLLLFVLLWVMQAAIPASAQTTLDSQWRVFRSEDGLISNNVWALIAMDDTIWLGTDLGIGRYDGTWTNFYNAAVQPSDEIPRSAVEDGYIVALAASQDGDAVWAGSTNGQVVRWDGTHWIAEFQVPAAVSELREIDGALYIGTDSGLWRHKLGQDGVERTADLASLTVTALAASSDTLWIGARDGLWAYRNDRLEQVALPAALGQPEINALWLDAAHVLWIGKSDGVIWYDPQRMIWSESLLPITNAQGIVKPVFTLIGNDSGDIWAGANGAGARKFVDYGLATIDVARTSGGGLTTPFVFDVAIDRDGSIWFATPVGLFQYQEQIWLTDFQDQDGLQPEINEINELLVDRYNALWIATAGAGVRYKEPAEVGYTERSFTTENSPLPDNGVLALAEDSDEHIWIGTLNGLARYANGRWDAPVARETLPSPLITALLVDKSGLWIGTDAGLAYFHRATEELEVFEALAGLAIEALALDSNEQLWAGTRRDGIWIRTTDESWRHDIYSPSDARSFPGNGVIANGLAQNPMIPGGMWAIVANGGLVYWDGSSWFNGDPQEKLPSGLLYRAYTDSEDAGLWIGTEAGVAHYDGLTWGALNVEDGLQSTAIYAIAQGDDGSYWFGGPDGLTRYWPEQTPPWIRIEGLTGASVDAVPPTVMLDEPAEVMVTFGDLQTPQSSIDLFYRLRGNLPIDGASGWSELPKEGLVLPTSALGNGTLEVMARDLAFNYSDVVAQPFAVISPPRTATLPILGEVETSIFWTLLLLGGTALLGFSYVSYEIIQNRQRAVAAVNRSYNPYVSGEPVRTTEMFFGRHALLQRIVDTLHNNSIMIHGERRIGKTTLLYQLAALLQTVDDPEYWFLPVYIDLEGTDEEEFFHSLIEEIARHTRDLPEGGAYFDDDLADLRYHAIPSADYRDRDFSNDIRTVVNALQGYGAAHHVGKRLRLILLMDEMDVMSEYDRLVQQQLRRIFMRDFSSTLGAVVAGIQISKDWDRVESPWYNLFNEIEVEPFDREAAIELLLEPIRDIYRYEPAAVEFIIDHSSGRPFRIQQYGLESVNIMLADGRRKVLLNDAEAAHERIQNHYSATDAAAGLRVSAANDAANGAGQAVAPADAVRDASSVGTHNAAAMVVTDTNAGFSNADSGHVSAAHHSASDETMTL